MDKLINQFCKLLDGVIAAMLALMVVLVFGNVVLRYGFNSGINLSEELSRWLFVWMTFLGAVVAVNERGHLGTDMLVGRLGPTGKRVCLGVGYVLMLFVCWLLFKGSWDQMKVNLDSTSAVMQVSMAWFYGAGAAFAVLAGVMLLRDLLKLLTGRVKDSELMMIQESEDKPHADADAAH
jgi:TRAP-type C4-dicarboxylate transport system permease small subunit